MARVPRRGYLDWLRGLAVLIMIEAHILDSWTRFDQRGSALYGLSMIVAGMGAPLFLFLAGLSVALSAGSKTRRSGDARAASNAVVRRGLEIFGLAFLFRLQAVIVSWGPWRSMLKVDILNIMGPSIMGAAALWGALRTPRARMAGFIAVALAIAYATPPVRGVEFLAPLPDPIEGYLRPRPGFTNFSFFPWAAFLFAGGAVGVLLDEFREGEAERRANVRIAIAGVLLTLGAYAASYLPTVYSNSVFWGSSPTFFLIRAGILVCAVPAAFLWTQRPTAAHFSPLEQMGRTSLFIYWIHIELIYGLMVRPIHKSLTFGQAWIGVLIFTILMVLVSVGKERFSSFGSRVWPRRSAGAPPRIVV